MEKKLENQPVMRFLVILLIQDLILILLSHSNSKKGLEISFLSFIEFMGIGIMIGILWFLIWKLIPYFKRLKHQVILALFFYLAIISILFIKSVNSYATFIIMMGYHMFLLLTLVIFQNKNESILRVSDVRNS